MDSAKPPKPWNKPRLWNNFSKKVTKTPTQIYQSFKTKLKIFGDELSCNLNSSGNFCWSFQCQNCNVVDQRLWIKIFVFNDAYHTMHTVAIRIGFNVVGSQIDS